MVLVGGIELQGKEYYLMLRDNKKSQIWFLVDKYHKQDRIRVLTGEELKEKVLDTVFDLKGKKFSTDDYLLEGLSVSKTNGKIKQIGNSPNLLRFLEAFTNVNTYSFGVNDIITKETTTTNGIYREEFRAEDLRISVNKIQENRIYQHLEFKTPTVSCLLRNDLKINFSINNTMIDAPEKETKAKVSSFTASSMTMNLIENLFDISWYKDVKTGKVHKNYKAIKSIPSFERNFMKGFIDRIRHCQAHGIEIVLCIDTETTGLIIAYLDKNNPAKDHIVATPISFKKDAGFVIFNDMAYFDNVPVEYMCNRLKNIVEDSDGEITIEYREFENDISLYTTEELLHNYVVKDSITIKRNDINLIGHNVMYDGKVLLDNGIQPRWDDDTLQMSFDLNPEVSRAKIKVVRNKTIETENGNYDDTVIEEVVGGVGLKNLTRRLFGHETLELSDVLGKGNEGSYRLIADEEVALLYGCADVDYPIQIREKVRNLMGEKMYRQYRKQDMTMLNILYPSEYYGLRMDTEAVLKLAEKAEKKMNLIKEFLYAYVGREIYYKEQSESIKNKYKSTCLPMFVFNLTEEEKQAREINKEKMREEIRNIDTSKAGKYIFEMKGKQIRDVLYDILNYPILGYTKSENPQPKVDKFTMKKLMSYKAETNTLLDDLKLEDGTVVIKAKDFNSYKYPVAFVLRTYLDIDKDYTSYFKPIKENNLEGRLFKSYSLARIQTRRIMNPAQTMKSSLKALTIPFDGGKDWYLVDFDMAQVEYRIMASLAGLTYMIERLKDPEKDFHTESASALTGIPAHKIEKAFRKKMKSVHFGIPYGLGDRSLCEQMHGEVNDENMAKTQQILYEFKTKNSLIINMLEHIRDKALEPCDLSDEVKRFAGFVDYKVEPTTGTVTEHLHNVGKVENLLGFYRLFDLENLDSKKIASIRRMAGNYPIQAFAAELFRMILIRFYKRCVREGIADKIKWHLLIHDELLFSAHKSLNPFYLYKLILEECMVTIKGHTKYFVGINIGDSWKECKDDLSEAPVLFVKRMVERWDAGEFKNDTWIENPKEYVNKYKDVYIKERIHEVITKIQPNIDTDVVDAEYIQDNFENYTVRAYLGDFYVPEYYKENSKEWKALSEEGRFIKSLECWIVEWYGEGKPILGFDGKVFKAKRSVVEQKPSEIYAEQPFTSEDEYIDIEVETDDDFMISYLGFDANNWSFDDTSLNEYSEALYSDDFDYSSLDNKFQFDMSKAKDAKSVVDLIADSEENSIHNYARLRGQSLIITLPSINLIDKIEEYLLPYKRRFGNHVMFRCGNLTRGSYIINSDVDILELNKYITELVEDMNRIKAISKTEFKNLKIRDSVILINTTNPKVLDSLKAYLRDKKASSGYSLKILVGTNRMRFEFLSYDTNLKELDDLIERNSKLTVAREEPLKYVSKRPTYILIDVKNDTVKKAVRSHLRPQLSSTGTLIRFNCNGRTESWTKVAKDVDLKELDKYIMEVSS